jgi:adenylate cyclase class 2
MKVREELETVIGDGDMLRHVFEELGMHVWFRYEKYREEYAAEDVTIAIDETPVGTFVEIEGGEEAILRTTELLGRSAADFILDSYRGLFIQHRERLGLRNGDMVFDEE